MDIPQHGLQNLISKHADYLMPFERLPNVSEFGITDLAPYQPLLLNKGDIKLRIDSPKMEYVKGRNSRMNHYLRYMFKQLNKNRGNSKIFWFLGKLLLCNSISFRLSCLKKIYPTWYKDEFVGFIKKILNKYNSLDLS